MNGVVPTRSAWKRIARVVRTVDGFHMKGGTQVNRPGFKTIPRPFDIKSNGEGIISVTRCWFQHLSKWVELDDEPEVAITTGRLCLCVDTSTGSSEKDPLVVTLVINPTPDPVNYPELKYFSLYKITAGGDPAASASIDFDLRSNIIVTTYE